ncbi:MAG: hypothetical protein J6W75_05345 [Bacteroidaceae bacterium]|nr:hypothetical protein [Bacteroidaceae bacterium]
MKTIVFLLATSCLLTASKLCGQEASTIHKVSRQTTLMGAKNLVLTTTNGQKYFYFVSNDETPMLYLGDSLRIGNDAYPLKRLKAMRFHSLEHVILDEDSTTFDRSRAFDHSLLALRRTLSTERWNSIVLPFDLTGLQVRDVFGEETMVASVRGVGEDDQTVVELQTLDILTDQAVMKANYHYLIRPSREPDVAEGKRLSSFINGTTLKGPVYLIPNISMKASQSARLQSFENEDASAKIRLRGTYLKLDDSVVSGRTIRNKRVAPGVYMLNEDGKIALTTDSTVVQAFSSWIENLSEDGRPLRFYIDGIGEDITAITDAIPSLSEARHAENDGIIFDLGGRRMPKGRLPKGIYVMNGKKVAIQ